MKLGIVGLPNVGKSTLFNAITNAGAISGSERPVTRLMKEALEKNGLTDKVNVSAAFCLGRCTDGVTIKVDDEIITGVSPDNFNEIFDKYVLKGNL